MIHHGPIPVRPARSRARTRVALAAAIPLAAALATLPVAAQAAQTPGLSSPTKKTYASTTASPVRVWAPEFMERRAKVDQARAIRDATNYPLLVATKKVYTPYVDAMKAARPGLVLALYSNGTFAKSDELKTIPNSALLKDAKGNLVKHRQYKLWLANPTDPDWVASRIALCRNGMAEYKYNGCLLDNLGPAPVDPNYVSAAPINPKTGKAWTEAEWIAATAELAKKVRAGISPAPLVGNSLGNGSSYLHKTKPTSPLMEGLDYGMSEVFLRGGKESVKSFPKAREWSNAVKMLEVASQQGRTILAAVKLWTSATEAQQQQWLRFSVATFLMGTDTKHRFYFSPSASASRTVYDPLLSTPIGDPVGAMVTVSGGGYKRTFTNGIAVVNPSGSSVTVALGGTYVDASGKSVTQVTLPANDGALLTLP